MKCPMTFNNGVGNVDYDCIGELCTWWVETTSYKDDKVIHGGMCAITKIATDLHIKGAR